MLHDFGDIAMSRTDNRYPCCRHFDDRHWKTSLGIPVTSSNTWGHEDMVLVAFLEQGRRGLISKQAGSWLQAVSGEHRENILFLSLALRLFSGITNKCDTEGNFVLKPSQGFQGIGDSFLLSKGGGQENTQWHCRIPKPRTEFDLVDPDPQVMYLNFMSRASQAQQTSGQVRSFTENKVNLTE